MKEHLSTIILAVSLGLVSILSLFIGVIDVRPVALLTGDTEVLEVFLISRLPRLLAILCTGIGMSVAGLIMQQLCMNKFISYNRSDDFIRSVWNTSGTFIYAEFYIVGSGGICICGSDSRDVDICLVYSADSV